MKKQRNNVNGWLVINKPVGVTSTKVVSIIKRIYNAKKVGHAGTLDPLAQGVLPIALGEATKTINYSMDAIKEYHFTIKWGEQTSTGDSEGEVIATSDELPNNDFVKDILPLFVGKIKQTPPAYSAIKVNGQRAYDLARAGKEVKLKSREIEIFKLNIIESSSSDKGEVTLSVLCSKGTYIRSLASDIAEKLGAKGHVTKLVRTKVGKFCIKDAILLDVFDNKVYKDELSGLILLVDEVLDDIPVLHINFDQTRAIRYGQKIKVAELQYSNDAVVALKSDNNLVALAIVEDGVVRPSKVFNL